MDKIIASPSAAIMLNETRLELGLDPTQLPTLYTDEAIPENHFVVFFEKAPKCNLVSAFWRYQIVCRDGREPCIVAVDD
jgi:hypothetical protein